MSDRETLPIPPIQELSKLPLFQRYLQRIFKRIENDGQIKWSQLDTKSDLGVTAANSTLSVTSADASDLATCITLANEIKADLNSLIAEINVLKDGLRDKGVLN